MVTLFIELGLGLSLSSCGLIALGLPKHIKSETLICAERPVDNVLVLGVSCKELDELRGVGIEMRLVVVSVGYFLMGRYEFSNVNCRGLGFLLKMVSEILKLVSQVTRICYALLKLAHFCLVCHILLFSDCLCVQACFFCFIEGVDVPLDFGNLVLLFGGRSVHLRHV